MTSLSDLDERSTTILSADVGWAPPAQAKAGVDRRRASRIGAGVAVAICIVIAAVGWLIAPEGWILGLVGLPVTTFLAWRMAPGVVAADRQEAVARAFGLTIATIVMADALVVALMMGAAVLGLAGTGMSPATDAVTGIIEVVGFGVIAFFFGAVIVGIPVVIVVVPAAPVWAAAVRQLVRRPG